MITFVRNGAPRRRVDKIDEDAAESAAAILREAHSERLRMEVSTKNQIDELREEYGRRLYEEIERMHTSSQEHIEREVAESLYSAREESLRLLRERFMVNITDADETMKERWFSLLLSYAVSDLGVGILHVRPADKQAAASSGFDVRYDLEAAGGLIAESADGTVLLDYTLESLARDYWALKLADIREKLFG